MAKKVQKKSRKLRTVAIQTIDGITVKDPRSPMEIEISAQDCKNGKTKQPAACAAARALCRIAGVAEARVHLSRTYVRKNDGNWYRYVTPAALRSEMVAFDRGGSFQPGDYKLMPLSPTQRYSVRKWRNAEIKAAGTRPQKRSKPHIIKGVRTRAAMVA